MQGKEIQEGQMIQLVRNALLVAGHEMGEGDHMPVIKSTIHKIMKDWEDLKVERNVQTELRRNIEYTIKELKAVHRDSPEDFKPEVEAAIKELNEVYDAAFGEVDASAQHVEIPDYMKRAKAIIKTLEEDDHGN